MRIITRIWKDQPGKYFCISTKSASGTWRDNFFSRSQFNKVVPFLRANLDKNLYWCPHGFTQKRRLKPYAVMPKLLWADIDELSPDDLKPKPTVLWESSPGRHAGVWVLDKPIPDDTLNRDLTYLIGADKGGWDLTQVLRVPGGKNYKYRSQPISRVLWTDGPTFTLAQIRRATRGVSKGVTVKSGDITEIWRKHEKSLPRDIRKEIMNGKPTRGKRSEVLWRIENALIEAGVPIDDCVTIIRHSPWNKFAGRKNEIEQITRELEKIVDDRLSSPETEQASDYKFLNVSIDDVEDKPIDWLWYPYIARGELTILEGLPGVGKSYLMQMIGMGLCDGLELPCYRDDMKRLTTGKVAYFDVENAGNVTKRRLMANGLKNGGNFLIEEEPFSVDDEAWDEVLDAIEREKPSLVVFDTINTYIGLADTGNAAQTQGAFGEFRQIARQFNCAVVVLRHWTKNAKEKALIDRGQGSMAFTGLARVVMAAIPHPKEPEMNLLALVKMNVGRMPPPLSYGIVSSPTKKDPDRSKFLWGEFEQESDFEELARMEKTKEDSGQRQQCEEIIVDQLSSGRWVSKHTLVEAANARTISKRTVERVLKIMLEQNVIEQSRMQSRALYRKVKTN